MSLGISAQHAMRMSTCLVGAVWTPRYSGKISPERVVYSVQICIRSYVVGSIKHNQHMDVKAEKSSYPYFAS